MKENGQSLVELAVSLVLLLLLLSGTVEFGMAFFQFIQLRDAAQEGALYGSVNPKNVQEIEIRARGESNSPIDLTNPNVKFSIVYSGMPCEGFKNSIKIVMEYDHKIFMPFLSAIVKSLRLHAEVTDTILAPTCP